MTRAFTMKIIRMCVRLRLPRVTRTVTRRNRGSRAEERPGINGTKAKNRQTDGIQPANVKKRLGSAGLQLFERPGEGQRDPTGRPSSQVGVFSSTLRIWTFCCKIRLLWQP